MPKKIISLYNTTRIIHNTDHHYYDHHAEDNHAETSDKVWYHKRIRFAMTYHSTNSKYNYIKNELHYLFRSDCTYNIIKNNNKKTLRNIYITDST